jgi:hypothetical protein
MRKSLFVSVCIAAIALPCLVMTGCQPEVRAMPPDSGQQSKHNLKVIIKDNPNIPDSAKGAIK